MLFRLSVWRNRWFATEFPSLPPADEADEACADYCQLAQGLAGLLRQCSPRGAERHFPAALQGFRRLKRQMKRRRALELPAQLLSDLCHEIAQHTDAVTLEAGVRCLRRSASGPAQAPVSSLLEGESTVFMAEPAPLRQPVELRRR